jgi:ligand-binding sensor domain-containing protein
MKLEIINIKKYLQFFLFFTTLLLFIYSCGKEVSTSPVEEEIPQAFLYVDSEPIGSTIYLSGKNTGRNTPDYIPFLEEGQYQITLKKKYFRDTTLTITLQDRDTLNVYVDYFQNPLMFGKITFNSAPINAEIILDDSITGLQTPAAISNLVPGKYVVKYKLYNHRESELDIVVESNKTTASYIQLRDTSQWVDYQIANSEIQSSLLTSIDSDNNNVKWIGTSNLGLISFDEIDFNNFNISNSGIPSNQVNCVKISGDNRVWVGTNNGLGIFDGISWQVYRSENSLLPNNNINAIEFDNLGAAWIGTNNGFAKFDGINWHRFNYTSSQFTYLWVTSLRFDDSNNLWIGSNNFGILKFDGSTYTEYVSSDFNFLTNKISAIAIDNVNKLWFGQLLENTVRGGVSIYNGSSFSNIYIGTINNKINSIYTSGNNKWLCTTEGLSKYDVNNSSIFFSALNSYLTNDNVTSAVNDLNGNLWITTYGGGLNKLKNQ